MSPFVVDSHAPEAGRQGITSMIGSSDYDRASSHQTPFTSCLQRATPVGTYDLICVGFGPASLAIAIALHDALLPRINTEQVSWQPRVCFLERQRSFGWHSGMLLPGSKMQISFIKDLATLRDPTSEFTFLNYLKRHNRLVQFANLGTFLPSRMEFEDYMRWCAGSFRDVVEYSQEVTRINPGTSRGKNLKIDHFMVESLDKQTGNLTSRKARHIVIAIGGSPRLPPTLPHGNPLVIHSSRYCRDIPSLLTSRDEQYHIAVIGSGQSAAEIFNDLHTRYPNARSTMIIRDSALRPSDDSPFVNEVFDPNNVSGFYDSSSQARSNALQSDKATNYGVVRLDLLEHIYHALYHQRINQPNERDWQHRILPSRTISRVVDGPAIRKLGVVMKNSRLGCTEENEEVLEVDALIAATGYVRNEYQSMLKDVARFGKGEDGQWRVGRDYKIGLDNNFFGDNVGVWLQGCNESTHGLSDTLLSILAVRGGEMVRSIFGEKLDSHARNVP